jgi:hypothetical protein
MDYLNNDEHQRHPPRYLNGLHKFWDFPLNTFEYLKKRKQLPKNHEKLNHLHNLSRMSICAF